MVVFAAGFLGRRPSGQGHADGTFSGRNVNGKTACAQITAEPAARPIKVNKRFKLLLAVETS
jgi:hypothetical protein